VPLQLVGAALECSTGGRVSGSGLSVVIPALIRRIISASISGSVGGEVYALSSRSTSAFTR
jgi:hypothetical protein